MNELLDLPCFESLENLNAALLTGFRHPTTDGVINGGKVDVAYYHDQVKDSVEVVRSWVKYNFPLSSQVSDLVCNGLVVVILQAIKSLNAGEIENSRFKEFKGDINDILTLVSRHYSDIARNKYDEENPNAEWNTRCNDIEVLSVWVSDIRELRSKHKNLLKSKNPLAHTNIPFITELLALADIQDQIKVILVPTKKAVSVKNIVKEANLVQHGCFKTCAYCLRKVRLKNNQSTTIAYHGFKRTDYSVSACSCKGADFEPFEVSPKGTLQHLADLVSGTEYAKKRIPELQESLEGIKDKKAISEINAQIAYYTYYIERHVPFTRELLQNALKKSYPSVTF